MLAWPSTCGVTDAIVTVLFLVLFGATVDVTTVAPPEPLFILLLAFSADVPNILSSCLVKCAS